MTSGNTLEFTLTERHLEQIRGLIRNENARAQVVRHGSKPNESESLQGFLYSDLESATDEIDGETTAELNVWYRNPATGELVDAARTITVTNRDVGFSASAGAYLKVFWLEGEWRPIASSGGMQVIMFTIVEANFCGECSARARVLSHSGSISSLPDIEEDYGRYFVTVYDKTYPNSCFLNEPPEDLMNRVGFAVYLNALEDGPCANTFGPRWHIMSLCCGEDQCGE